MKAILIDPDTQTVAVCEHDGGLESLYKLLDCQSIEAPIQYDNNDIMYCDEESWLHISDSDNLSGFMFPNWRYPILGRGLIVGTDDEGEDVDCNSDPLDFINIMWCNHVTMVKHGISIGML